MLRIVLVVSIGLALLSSVALTGCGRKATPTPYIDQWTQKPYTLYWSQKPTEVTGFEAKKKGRHYQVKLTKSDGRAEVLDMVPEGDKLVSASQKKAGVRVKIVRFANTGLLVIFFNGSEYENICEFHPVINEQ